MPKELEKIVNLINIKIKSNLYAEIELLYKAPEIGDDIQFFLLTNNNEKLMPKKTISFLEEDIKKIKLVFEINLSSEQDFQLKINENGELFNVKLLNNKDEAIVVEPNTYTIFTKKMTLSIKPERAGFLVQKKKFASKLIYEINKQKYAKKKYNRFFILRWFKGKEKYYLFNDRIMYGDDNAEELFKYINEKHKKMAKRSYFVLDAKSDRIDHVKKLGKVVLYGSLKHKLLYLNSKMVISSHGSYYDRIYNPFNDQEMDIYKDKICKEFVFLQHGVIGADLHGMLNRCNIIADLFVTSTHREYEEVKANSYLYDNESVICTGLARFDKLVDDRKKYILIAPTWRAYLTQVEYTNDKANSIEQSEFYKKYKSLLQNKDLLKELETLGYKIQFLLHPVFEEHKHLFIKLQNEFVQILSTKDIQYSQLFRECSLFITDYSSTHFDVAFLKKPIIYYQFDKQKFYESHYKKGSFDEFGQVIENEEELVNKIKYYLENDCKIEEKYKNIIENTFAYVDYNNSERIYQEIIKLADKNEKNYRFNNVH